MPSYKELLGLLKEGKSPSQIIDLLDMRPSRWRKMIEGKRFRDALATEEQLAAIMAAHGIAAGMHDAAERFSELLTCDKPETVRKVALALLHEGLAAAGREGESAPAASPQLNVWDAREEAESSRWQSHGQSGQKDPEE